MTFGDLKALVGNFEAVDDNMKLVVTDPETGRLVELHMHDVSVVGRDDKNKECAFSDGYEKVMHVFVSTD
jgi:hypothetical protein